MSDECQVSRDEILSFTHHSTPTRFDSRVISRQGFDRGAPFGSASGSKTAERRYY
jgi:hypothetical protein